MSDKEYDRQIRDKRFGCGCGCGGIKYPMNKIDNEIDLTKTRKA
jgi:hypothetical protein